MKNAVVSGGEFVSLAVIRSLGKKNITTTVISENNRALAFHSKYCNKKIITDTPIDCFTGFSEKDLIMPILEHQMIALTKNRKKFSCTFAFPDYHILEMASNKKIVLEYARELNIPCPKTILCENSEAVSQYTDQGSDQVQFPMVIKPIRGRGGEGISLVNSAKEFQKIGEESIKKWGPVLLQEKIPYSERYSVVILMNFNQQMKRFCVLREIRYFPLETGPATFVETINRPDLVNQAQQILESLKYYGIAELDFVNDPRDNIPKLMEINPRFWGSLQGAISAGIDFPYLLFKLFTEGDIDNKQGYNIGVKTRHVFLDDYRRLLAIIRGNYSTENKLASLIEFLKFHQDDAYFIFDRDDMKPFLSLVLDPLQRRLEKMSKIRLKPTR
jgi:predicted ATP-grasp superfamily ATP-dependent carboligase